MGHTSTTLVLFANFIFISYASWIDLSHTYNESTLHWPTNRKFTLEVINAEYLDDGRWMATNNFCSGEHSGTHLDVPYHFNRNGWTVDKIPLDHLLGLRTAVIDISHRVNRNIDPVDLTIEDINAWEAVHGLIPRLFHFLELTATTAQWLVDNREIVGVGVDTASTDGRAPTYSHTTLTGKNIYLLENLAHTDQLPAKGAVVYVFPMNIQNGTGAPVRVVAEKAESYGFGSCWVEFNVYVMIFLLTLVALDLVYQFLFDLLELQIQTCMSLRRLEYTKHHHQNVMQNWNTVVHVTQNENN